MTTVVVGQKEHVFPADMSRDEIDSVLRVTYPQEALGAPDPADPQPPATPIGDELMDDPSFVDRMQDNLADVRLDIQDTMANQTGQLQYEQALMGEEPNRYINPLEAGVQNTGSFTRGLFSTFEEGTLEGIQEINQFTNGALTDGWDAFAESPVGKGLIKMYNRGSDAWQNLVEQYPEGTKTLASAIESGTLGFKGPQANKVAQMLAPADKRGERGKTRENILRQRTYKPDEDEMEVAKQTAKVPGIMPTRTYTYNHQKVEQDVGRRQRKLDRDIRRHGNPEFDRADLNQRLADKVEWMDQLDEATGLSTEAQRYASQIMEKAQQLINESDGTALGLLNARRRLDGWVKDRFSDKAFDPNLINGRTVANKIIRTELNTTVDNAVPKAKVKKQLHEQHLLLQARDSLYDHMGPEGLNPLSRFIQGVGQGHVGPVGAYALASGVGGIIGKLTTDSLTIGGASGALSLAALKTLTRAERRRLLGAAIQFYNGEIEKDPENAGHKKDKQVLLDMLNEGLFEVGEVSSENSKGMF